MTDELCGTVEVLVTGVGSRSEMTSVVLHVDPGTDAGEATTYDVKLRRRDPLALDAEEELAAYAGRHVRVRGSLVWTTFVVDEIEELPSGGGSRSDLDET